MFAQPFLASGKYTSFKEFAEVKSRHMISARCVGPGVMRWEYRPGSTLYFVWAQERDGFDQFGDFNFSRDRSALFPGIGRRTSSRSKGPTGSDASACC